MLIMKRTSNRGYTIVEVLVVVGLFSLLSAAVAVVSLGFLKNAKQTSLRMARDQIVNQLINTTTTKKAIVNSLNKPENIAFYNCVCGIDTCTNMLKPFLPFTLYDTSTNIQSPRFYDDAGASCDPSKARCRIRVTTSFFAQCKPDFSSANQSPPANCNGVPADFVAIMYSVDENPDIPVTDQQNVLLKKISGPTYIQVADIAPGVCP